MENENVYEIEFSGHSTKREWAVYIIIAIDKTSAIRKLYVGKVGDNRDGCNPILSRIGNHFSLNKIHSQLRNKIVVTDRFDYKVLYSIFGRYSKDNLLKERERINQIERELNLIIQEKATCNFELLNPLKGTGITKRVLLERRKLLTEQDMKVLHQIAERALTINS